MQIEIVGAGCAKCNKLYAIAEAAIARSGVSAELSKVEQLHEIASYGVLRPPALVLNGRVRCSGQLPAVEEVAEWLIAARG